MASRNQLRLACLLIAWLVGGAGAVSVPGISTYVLTDSDMEILASPDRILKILDKQVGEKYQDTTQLLEAIKADLGGRAEIFRTISSIVRTEISPPSVSGDTVGCGVDFGTKCPVQEIWLDSLSVERLKSKLMVQRKLTPLSRPLLDLVGEIRNVEYPQEELLHQAVLSRLKGGVGACMANLPASQTYARSLRLPDASFDTMMNQLIPLSGGIPPREIGGNSTIGLLKTFRAESKVCDMMVKDQLHQLLEGVYDSTLRESVKGLGRKIRSAAPSAPRWSPGGCGCVRPNLNGVVFGFYPWWQADTSVQTFDFSVLNHLEFQGVSFDDAGVLTEFDPPGNDGQFLTRARDHGVLVDWVVSRSDWKEWKSLPLAQRQAMFDTLAFRIVLFLTKPLPGAWSRIKAAIPYPTSERFTWGDGVTLHFEGYPKGREEKDLFFSFVRRVDSLMKRTDPDLHLNLMLSRGDLEADGIYSYDNLVSLLRLRGVDSSRKSEERTHLLVMLDEFSSDTKKLLQRELDFHLHGGDRKLFVRALVPVSVFDGKNWPQLADDILYDNDTYYGMGLWPAPFAGSDQASKQGNAAERLAQAIADNYRSESLPASRLRWLEDLVCLNRWTFRILLFSSIAFSLAASLAISISCPLRHFLGPRVVIASAALVVLPLAYFTLLLYFDPDLSALSRGNAPFVVLASLTVLGAVGAGIYLRSRKAKPSREALREEMRRMGGGG